MSTIAKLRAAAKSETASKAVITQEMRDNADETILNAVAATIAAEKDAQKQFVLRKQAYRVLNAFKVTEWKGIGKAGATLKVADMPSAAPAESESKAN